ncbi:hypothetical protein [Macrococcus capreoli]|uniref:hypothetical protein n=1 Tax=Macrococcus capreoli TaxID=2982690 RepID=UPI0021D5CB97|nr:hypothetical protein [Macrococcus sp. TMW 2.2395]MCU7556553.1 hypothetical protein [Macrococcus sp. TMW 2.2395]
MYSFSDDYKTDFSAYVDDLFLRLNTLGYGIYTQEERIEDAKRLTDAYITQTNKRPATGQLDRLSTLILKEDKKKRKGKAVVVEEYPALSERQLETRMRNETSFIGSSTYDSAGVNRNMPTRINRIKNELKTKKIK